MASMWLFKSDPEHYSFADLHRDGKAVWDGISSNAALKNLRAVRRGDRVLVYHTGLERAVVGTAEVASDPYPDPKQEDPKLVVVDLAAKDKLPRPVTLAEIKAESARNETLRTFDLVRQPRLSVMPVSGEQWKAILALSRK
jgi:predicted RNA-binding protein with PUA-like domain